MPDTIFGWLLLLLAWIGAGLLVAMLVGAAAQVEQIIRKREGSPE